MIYYFQGEVEMSLFKSVKRVLVGLTAALFLMSVGNLSAKEIKIGVIYDYTGQKRKRQHQGTTCHKATRNLILSDHRKLSVKGTVVSGV